MMTREDVLELVGERLSQILAVEPDRVTAEARLVGDLHADSLDRVEAMESIEESLRRRGYVVHLPASALAGWHTVGDAVTDIVCALKERGA